MKRITDRIQILPNSLTPSFPLVTYPHTHPDIHSYVKYQLTTLLHVELGKYDIFFYSEDVKNLLDNSNPNKHIYIYLL